MMHFWKKSLKFHEKNWHKIVYKKKLYNIKKILRTFAGERNFEYTFQISDGSVKVCLSYVSSQLKKRGFREKRV